MYMNYPPYPPHTVPATNGMATAGMTLGIIGFCLSWIPIIGVIIGAVGLTLAILGLVRSSEIGQVGQARSISGIVLSGLTILVFILMIVSRL